MTRIKKEINMGLGIKIFLVIDDGIAVMTCSHPEALKKIYFEAKKNPVNKTRILSYDFREHAMIEKYPGLTSGEIEGMLDLDISKALKKQKEIVEKKQTKQNGK